MKFKDLIDIANESLITLRDFDPHNADPYTQEGRAVMLFNDAIKDTDYPFAFIEENNVEHFQRLLAALKKVPAKYDLNSTDVTTGAANG